MTERCEKCGNPFEIGDWPYCPHGRPHGAIGRPAHPKERVVVWRNPETGKVAYPPANDVPMPERYQKWGYERVELPTLRAVEKFEKEADVRSEIAWHDKGTGSADYMPDPPQIDMTGISISTEPL